MKPLIIALIVFILGILGLFNPIRDVFQRVMAPAQYGTLAVSRNIKDTVLYFSNLEKIYEENVELVQGTVNLKAQLVELENLRQENNLLKEQLGLKGEMGLSEDLVLANVLGNSLDGSGTSLVLDKGSKSGISVNNQVIRGGYLIGRISRVLDERSVVELTTSPELSSSVVDIKTRTEAVVVGQYGTSIKMHRILPNEAVSVGDIIVTSGKDGRFLPGFIVGEIDSVSGESASSLKNAMIKTLFNLGSLDKVFIILGQ